MFLVEFAHTHCEGARAITDGVKPGFGGYQIVLWQSHEERCRCFCCTCLFACVEGEACASGTSMQSTVSVRGLTIVEYREAIATLTANVDWLLVCNLLHLDFCREVWKV